MWNEGNCMVIWTFIGITFLGTGMKTDLFQSCGHCWVFQICWHIECSTLTASSFRIWNSSAVLLSLPLILFVVTLPRPTWLHNPGCLALGEWLHEQKSLAGYSPLGSKESDMTEWLTVSLSTGHPLPQTHTHTYTHTHTHQSLFCILCIHSGWRQSFNCMPKLLFWSFSFYRV